MIAWIIRFTNKRVCTVEQFTLACEEAIECAKKDADGFLNVKELIKLVYVFIVKYRTK